MSMYKYSTMTKTREMYRMNILTKDTPIGRIIYNPVPAIARNTANIINSSMKDMISVDIPDINRALIQRDTRVNRRVSHNYRNNRTKQIR